MSYHYSRRRVPHSAFRSTISDEEILRRLGLLNLTQVLELQRKLAGRVIRKPIDLPGAGIHGSVRPQKVRVRDHYVLVLLGIRDVDGQLHDRTLGPAGPLRGLIDQHIGTLILAARARKAARVRAPAADRVGAKQVGEMEPQRTAIAPTLVNGATTIPKGVTPPIGEGGGETKPVLMVPDLSPVSSPPTVPMSPSKLEIPNAPSEGMRGVLCVKRGGAYAPQASLRVEAHPTDRTLLEVMEEEIDDPENRLAIIKVIFMVAVCLGVLGLFHWIASLLGLPGA